jgi:hypothetical protein
MATYDRETGVYQYKASHVLPIVFACVLSLSLGMHIYQNTYVYDPEVASSLLFT